MDRAFCSAERADGGLREYLMDWIVLLLDGFIKSDGSTAGGRRLSTPILDTGFRIAFRGPFTGHRHSQRRV